MDRNRRLLVVQFASLLGSAVLALLATPAFAQLAPGTIVVADFEAGPLDKGLLFQVDLTTGDRTVLSDFGDAGQGPVGEGPYGVAMRDGSTIFVTDNQSLSGFGALYTVDPSTGERTILSDFADSDQGPLGDEPLGVLATGEWIYVVDKDAGTGQLGALFRIDPATGDRTIVSDFGDGGQGPLGVSPSTIARGPGGALLVADPDGGTDEHGGLFRIDPVSGTRTLISDFGDSKLGELGVNPGGVASGAAGVILVTDTEAGTDNKGALFAVDPATGERTVLSDFGSALKGTLGVDPFHIALAASGEILVIDDDAGTDLDDGHIGGNGALFVVNRTNGNRTLVSDFGDAKQGTVGVEPSGVAIVPAIRPGMALVVDPFAGQGLLFGVDRTTGDRVVISDFDLVAQGPTGIDPNDVALGLGGDIWVVDEDLAGAGALVRIDPNNGSRTIVSDLDDGSQGPTASIPRGVALDRDGTLLVVTANGGTGDLGTLLRVDAATGMRTLLSDFGAAGQGPLGSAPESVVPGFPGEALVIDPDATGTGVPLGRLFRVDLETGERTVISEFTDAMLGPAGSNPVGVVLESGGSILVTDYNVGLTVGSVGVVFRVNRATGARTVVTDFGIGAQGTTGNNPRAAVLELDGGMPTGQVLVLEGGPNDRLFRVDPTSGFRTLISDFADAGQGATGAAVPQGLALYSEAEPSFPAVFADGFESGDRTRWMSSIP